MVQEHGAAPRLQFRDNCGVCGRPLVYGVEPVTLHCAFCDEPAATLIYCSEAHYVCSSCHEREALDILRQVVDTSTSTDPAEILEHVMSHPSVPMHGPEHHAMVPAVIVASVRNAGYPIPPDAVETAVTRGAKVPGGWCGYYGACGAAVGVGIAVSVLTEATPRTGKQRTLALEATSAALSRMLDGYPRCCKRAGRKALEAAVDFLHERMNISLDASRSVRCTYSERNKECPRKNCSYYVQN